MKKQFLTLSFGFLLGCFYQETTGGDFFLPKANADLSGIDYYELRGDRDFKLAVEYVIENCGVDGTGYVEGDRLYGFEGNISC